MKKIKGYEGEEGSMVDGKDYGGSSGTGKYAPEPAAKKQRTVTKEQLAKSGLSLRDFLNKERGLTRRGESAARMPPSVSAEVTQTSAPATAAAPVDVTKMSANERIKQDIRDTLAGARSGSGKTDTRSINERIRSALGAGKDRGGNTVDFEGSGLGMKSGGKVSKASSRADGIAQRGKTRGKMC